jgi:hypothetical protein
MELHEGPGAMLDGAKDTVAARSKSFANIVDKIKGVFRSRTGPVKGYG